ncbi:unnamed protein product [Dibothriocephalus latus]|uniref:Uncharacterized protein n=1 Tax=Dibothriocephalus latus TaxID=60516 RepID=A0A3P7NNV1_DIBLA|nr:unnamed protein product [Dibothriocephalus latus]
MPMLSIQFNVVSVGEELEAETVQEGETVSCRPLLGDTLLTAGASEIDQEDVFAAFLWVSSQLEAPDLYANPDDLNDDDDDSEEAEAEDEKETSVRRGKSSTTSDLFLFF